MFAGLKAAFLAQFNFTFLLYNFECDAVKIGVIFADFSQFCMFSLTFYFSRLLIFAFIEGLPFSLKFELLRLTHYSVDYPAIVPFLGVFKMEAKSCFYYFSEDDGKAERRAAVLAAAELPSEFFPEETAAICAPIFAGDYQFILEGYIRSGKRQVRWLRRYKGAGHSVRGQWHGLNLACKRIKNDAAYDFALFAPSSYFLKFIGKEFPAIESALLCRETDLRGIDPSHIDLFKDAVRHAFFYIKNTPSIEEYPMGRWICTQGVLCGSDGESSSANRHYRELSGSLCAGELCCSFFVCRQFWGWAYRHQIHPVSERSSFALAVSVAPFYAYKSIRAPRRKKPKPKPSWDYSDDPTANLSPEVKKRIRPGKDHVTIIEHEPPRWRDM
jgi:hypothetical protein